MVRCVVCCALTEDSDCRCTVAEGDHAKTNQPTNSLILNGTLRHFFKLGAVTHRLQLHYVNYSVSECTDITFFFNIAMNELMGLVFSITGSN